MKSVLEVYSWNLKYAPFYPLNPDIVAKPKGFVERDFSEAPSFTQPLADHTSTPGYSTQLFCSVRASPKVRAEAPLCPGRVGAGGMPTPAHNLLSSPLTMPP